ncbi:TadE/TadG family type IV pilus assembly protein [Microbacterium sp. RD1]|uniref:TadE/TadG family type IV pilus assembly protein n=1 Tax=Microbacterium sp. RD1 TaxID=3457313 RepID=UPI003FA5256F
MAERRRMRPARLVQALSDDAGSSPVEFVLVGALLTLLTIGVMQLGVAVYVRNVVHDAAVEGAFHAALADTTLSDGAERTRQIVARSVGESYASDVAVTERASASGPSVRVTVRTTLPLLGLLGAERVLEVSADAPVETLE